MLARWPARVYCCKRVSTHAEEDKEIHDGVDGEALGMVAEDEAENKADGHAGAADRSSEEPLPAPTPRLC